jgi:hypothetical protein
MSRALVSPSSEEGDREKEPAPSPIGLRQFWGIVSVIAVGAVVCLLGLLLTDPAENDWAIGVYAGGLISAASAAVAVGQLAARRRRTVVEAELAVAELERAVREFGLGKGEMGERRELHSGVDQARSFRSALLAAEAFDQARELDRTVATAQRLLRLDH